MTHLFVNNVHITLVPQSREQAMFEMQCIGSFTIDSSSQRTETYYVIYYKYVIEYCHVLSILYSQNCSHSLETYPII